MNWINNGKVERTRIKVQEQDEATNMAPLKELLIQKIQAEVPVLAKNIIRKVKL